MSPAFCNYGQLRSVFFNIADKERAKIGSNFPMIDSAVTSFLNYKGFKDDKAQS